MKHTCALLLLLVIAAMSSSVGAQVAPVTNQWGEPVDGVQLQLSLATTGQPALPGELPAFDVQIRNQGLTVVTANPEALSGGQIEIDDAWYTMIYDVLGILPSVVIAPGSEALVTRIYPIASSMVAEGATPRRSFELRPGPHRVRVRNSTHALNIRLADGKLLTLVSNRVRIDVPQLSTAAEREALVAQTSAGSFDAARRLVERYPDAALPAIEKAIAATADAEARERYVALAGTILCRCRPDGVLGAAMEIRRPSE